MGVVRVIDESVDHRVVNFCIFVKHPHYLMHVVSAASVMEVEEAKLSAHRTEIALYFSRVMLSLPILDVPSKKDLKRLGQLLFGRVSVRIEKFPVMRALEVESHPVLPPSPTGIRVDDERDGKIFQDLLGQFCFLVFMLMLEI